MNNECKIDTVKPLRIGEKGIYKRIKGSYINSSQSMHNATKILINEK